MTRIAIVSFIAVFLLGISVSGVFAAPVSIEVSTVESQQAKMGNSVLQLSSVGLASENPGMPVIQGENGVVVFVLDSFQGEESHGKNVLRIMKRSSFDKGKVEIVDLGYAINKKEYLKALTRISDWVQNNPKARVVVNLSFGSYSYDTLEHTLIRELSNKGVIIVAAAGNENTSSECYPAAYDEAMAVAAVNNSGRKEKYSNYGPWIDIAAEGYLSTQIQSIGTEEYGLYREQKITYLITGGTSFAAPRVAGLIAYLLHQRSDLSSSDIIELTKNTTEPIEEYLYNEGELGVGRLSPYRVLRKADHFFENLIKAQIMGLFLFTIIWLVEWIIGLFKRPRDFITPFMSGVMGGIAIYLIRVITIAAKGLLVGNMVTTGILFLVGTLSVIIPPYLWWIAEREKKRYQEMHNLMETWDNNGEYDRKN